jgi:UPF0716 protein FxsA
MRWMLLAILMGFPLLEGAVLYRLATGPQGSGFWVLAWLAFAAAAGIVLIKQARFSLLARLTGALAQGRFSLGALIDSFRAVFAGLLLIFPGIISDVMAVALLLLPIREPALQELRQPPSPGNRNRVIEGEYHREPR